MSIETQKIVYPHLGIIDEVEMEILEPDIPTEPEDHTPPIPETKTQ